MFLRYDRPTFGRRYLTSWIGMGESVDAAGGGTSPKTAREATGQGASDEPREPCKKVRRGGRSPALTSFTWGRFSLCAKRGCQADLFGGARRSRKAEPPVGAGDRRYAERNSFEFRVFMFDPPPAGGPDDGMASRELGHRLLRKLRSRSRMGGRAALFLRP